MNMKNVLLLFLFSLISLFTTAQNAQQPELRFRAGIILGLNASQVDVDDYAGFNKLGINSGFMAELPVSKSFSFSAEILYTQKGSKSHTVTGVPLEYKLRLNYAEIPLVCSFSVKPSLNFGLGLSYSRLLRSREFIN